jgi:Zn-dependent M28 family amino/carboxypeptidase
MAGAHLDSVDAGAGMNDNASGVAALLAAAERLTARPPADGARVRIGFWAAEELGLIGSRRHVERLDAGERRALRAYVNLDMVGSPEGRAMVYGEGDVASELRAGVRAEGLTPGRTSIGSASDHAPFRRAGIPVGGLYTGAGRPYDACYHRACDDRDNVDDALAADMAGAATRAIRALAAR